MRSDKHLALKLRLSGKSYTEIKKLLGVPKSTLSGWFSHLETSDRLKSKIYQRGREKSITILIKRNKNQTTVAIERKNAIIRKAKKDIKNIGKKDLLLLGAALYWAEGHKRPLRKNGRELTNHSVSLTNSDPDLIKLFLRFLREICCVPEEKITANIRIFEHQNEKYLLNFWKNITGVPERNFSKTYYGVSKSSLGKRPFNILPFGTIQIRVNNTILFHRIMGWIAGLKMPR